MPNTFYPSVQLVKTKDVPTPRYAREGDAGMDLCATEDVTLLPGQSAVMGSGIRVAIPTGFKGTVYARSGLGCKGLVIKNGSGIIDSGYRGEIGLTLFNNNPTHVWVERKGFMRLLKGRMHLVPNTEGVIEVHAGDRVAQFVIEPVAKSDIIEVDELPDSARGTDGFGSTGTRYERL